MKRTPHPLIPALLALALAAPAGAAAPAAVDAGAEQPFLEDLPVVLSASRLPQSLADAPGALTVLDAELIHATGYRTIADLLRLVPGFNVAWLNGHWPVVNYHGLSGEFPNRLQVLVDGRSIYSGFFLGGVDWISQPLALEDIDRIEVLRGSNSATYGSNAFLGVINIITRHASQSKGVYASASYGGDGVNDKTVRLGYGGESFDLRVTASQLKDSGLPFMPDSSRRQFGNLRADIRPTAADELTLAFGYQYGSGGEGYDSDPFNPARPRYTRTGYQQLRWRHVFAPDHEVVLQFYRNSEKWTDDFVIGPPELPIPVAFNQNRDSQRHSFELQHFFRLSDTLRGIWGAEFKKDSTRGPIFLGSDDPAKTFTRRLFANLEWRPLRRLVVNAGAMAERFTFTGTDVTPRAFVSFEAAPGHVLRAGVSTATRTPSIFEEKANVQFTPEGFPIDPQIVTQGGLDPERILSQEVGYFGKIPAIGLQADVRLYRERLSDLIVQTTVRARAFNNDPTPVVLSYDNVGEATLRGIEYQIKLAPFPATQLALAQAFQNISHPDPRVQGSSPRRTTSLMWTQQLPGGVYFNAIHYRVGAIEWLEFGDRIDSYFRTDLNLGWRFRLGAARAELSGTVLNVGGRYNEFRNGNFPNEQAFDQRAYVTLRLEL